VSNPVPLEEYRQENDSIVTYRVIGTDQIVRFSAAKIRQERTGIHAHVQIQLGAFTLGWGTINVDKDEDRTKLSNSAYKQLNGTGATYTTAWLKKDLDDFCRGLWDEHVGQHVPEKFAGALVREAPRFLLDPFVLEAGSTILFAPPGRGKSYISLLLAVSIDAGSTRLWQTRQRPVIFVNLERPTESLHQRLGNVNAALGLPRDRAITMLNRRGHSLADIYHGLERGMRDEPEALLFLDSISRAGMGDLTANETGGRIIDQLNRLTDRWFGLGHTPRADDSHLFGTMQFDAGADVMVQLLSDQPHQDLGLGLKLRKQNDVGPRPLWTHALCFDEKGLCGLRQTHRGEFPELEAGRQPTLFELVRQYVLDREQCPQALTTAGRAARATGANRSNISTMFKNDGRWQLVPRPGKEQWYGLASS